jgi:hypothetical protein
MARIPERIVEVNVGPPGALGLKLTGLYTEFDVERQNGSTPNKANISVYNLGEQSIRTIEKPGNLVQLLAGEDIVAQLFFGDVAKRGVKTKQNGVNKITTISAADGRRQFRESVFVRSYPPGTVNRRIINDVIAVMGLSTGFISPSLPTVTFSSGWAFAGKGRDAFTELLEPHDAIWDIQDRALNILMPGDIIPGGAVLLSAKSGLRGSPERTDKGVNFVSRLDPRIFPSRVVVLDALRLKGDFKVTKVKHRGNSRGSVWESQGTAVPR